MYLAGIVADGAQMSKKQLESWAKTATWHMLSDYTVPGVATESPHAHELATKWIRSKKESIASSGWSTYAGIIAIKPDDELDLTERRRRIAAIGRYCSARAAEALVTSACEGGSSPANVRILGRDGLRADAQPALCSWAYS